MHSFWKNNPLRHYSQTLAYTLEGVALTSSRREYYNPPCGIIFSENREKFIAINNFFVNETKVWTTK